MTRTVSILLGDEDRKRLVAIASDRSRPLKHVQRARIILYSAERLPVLEIARRASAGLRCGANLNPWQKLRRKQPVQHLQFCA